VHVYQLFGEEGGPRQHLEQQKKTFFSRQKNWWQMMFLDLIKIENDFIASSQMSTKLDAWITAVW